MPKLLPDTWPEPGPYISPLLNTCIHGAFLIFWLGIQGLLQIGLDRIHRVPHEFGRWHWQQFGIDDTLCIIFQILFATFTLYETSRPLITDVRILNARERKRLREAKEQLETQ